MRYLASLGLDPTETAQASIALCGFERNERFRTEMASMCLARRANQ
jgi:hypothetical protein